MKVLVTGGAGNIGLSVLKLLEEQNIETALFDLSEGVDINKDFISPNTEIFTGSVLDKSALSQALKGCTDVIHLAAVLGVKNTETNNLNCLEINIKGTENILSASISEKISKFIFTSSSEVYGEPLSLPISETSITQGKTLYGISKLAGEEFVKGYAQRYPALDYSILRLFNSFGPYQVGQFVVQKFIQNALQEKPIVINGDGMQKRAFCYVDDTAQGIVSALLSDKTNSEVINIGNDSDSNFISILELAQMILRILGLSEEGRIVFNKDFKNTDRNTSREINLRCPDVSKAKSLIDFKPQVSLEKAIEKIIKIGNYTEDWSYKR
jgi:UDP-glucose 4-epimerase